MPVNSINLVKNSNYNNSQPVGAKMMTESMALWPWHDLFYSVELG